MAINFLGKPCVYVGMMGTSPDERFDEHKAGIKTNKYVQLYQLLALVSHRVIENGTDALCSFSRLWRVFRSGLSGFDSYVIERTTICHSYYHCRG